MTFDLFVRGASQAVTCDAPGSAELGSRVGAVIGVRGGRIEYLGDESAVPPSSIGPDTAVIDAANGFVGPGFVDAHTHAVFAGERSREFEMRAQGKTYLEIGAAGGGIASTVKATRAANEETLVALALPRLARLLSWGVTHAEVKSGYGLSVEDELKMLRVVRRLASLQPITLTSTLLCAHAVPPEYRERRADYVRLCIDELIPRVAEEGLADFCDAFVEEGAFTAEEGRAILTAAAERGMKLRLHVDQLRPDGHGAQLAASLGAACADHLEEISPGGIDALRDAQTCAVLIPVSTLFLRQTRYAPGRALLDAGVTVGLGTNVNPGSAMSENVGLTLGLAVLQNGLTANEAFVAFTRGSAQALRLPERGRLRVGGPADFVVFSCREPAHLPYHLGINHVSQVVKGGRLVHSTPSLAPCE